MEKVQKPYYEMNIFEKMWFNIKNAFKQKISKFHFSIIKLIIAIIIIAIITVVIVVIISNRTEFPIKAAYDKTGFKTYEEIKKDGEHFENNAYSFDIDYNTTHITLTDKIKNVLWQSAPTNKKKVDTITVYYASGISEVKEFGNYNYSIDYLDTKNYLIRENINENSIEILYKFGGKIKADYTDFPEVIEKSRYEEKVLNVFNEYVNQATGAEKTKARTALRILKATYKTSSELNEYTRDGGAELSSEFIENLYYVFYTVCGYTKEDLEYDNEQYGRTNKRSYPQFEVSIKYTLTDDGLVVELINESIVDYESEPLVYIDVLPYFGCGGKDDQGYALIPDGSGVILDFNSKRSYTSRYESRIYGTDYSITNEVAPKDNEKINLGVYGMKVNDSSFINIVEKGAESCSIVYLNSDNARQYNTTNYRYYYRECDYYWFSSLSKPVNITTWSNQYNTSTLKLLIKRVDNDGDYTNMAKAYQDYLVKNKILNSKDETSNVTLDLTLLGGYLQEKRFLGVPYHKVSSLTNTDEVKIIVDELLKEGIVNLNVMYEGFYNQGIKATYAGKINYHSVIGSRKKLESLNEYLDSNNVNFYPTFRVSSAYTKDNLKDKMIVKNIYGDDVARYDVLEPTYLLNKDTTPLYTLHIDTYQKTLKRITNELDKIGISNIGFLDFGSEIYGNYQNKYTYYRSDCLNEYQKSMNEYIGKFNNVMTNNPNDYAFSYTDIALNIPSKGTDYQIVLYSVPFYQLVVSGYLDYSFEPFNLNDEYSIDYYKMKALEYASNISMIWTYSKTDTLIGTEYDKYYSTYYKNWFVDTIDIYKEMNQTGVYKGALLYHNVLDEKGLITKSIYDNGLEIIFNYTNKTYMDGNLEVLPNSYKIIKEALNG